jgi:hypothetical protein
VTVSATTSAADLTRSAGASVTVTGIRRGLAGGRKIVARLSLTKTKKPAARLCGRLED